MSGVDFKVPAKRWNETCCWTSVIYVQKCRQYCPVTELVKWYKFILSCIRRQTIDKFVLNSRIKKELGEMAKKTLTEIAGLTWRLAFFSIFFKFPVLIFVVLFALRKSRLYIADLNLPFYTENIYKWRYDVILFCLSRCSIQF